MIQHLLSCFYPKLSLSSNQSSVYSVDNRLCLKANAILVIGLILHRLYTACRTEDCILVRWEQYPEDRVKQLNQQKILSNEMKGEKFLTLRKTYPCHKMTIEFHAWTESLRETTTFTRSFFQAKSTQEQKPTKARRKLPSKESWPSPGKKKKISRFWQVQGRAA